MRDDDDLREPLGEGHEHLPEVDSTNTLATTRLTAGSVHPRTLISADRQTAGRGRMGRHWDSDGLDVYATMVLSLGAPHPDHAIGALGLAVGAALRAALVEVSPLRPELKWPNDLLVSGRKLAGILVEARWAGPAPDLIIGFGINVGREDFADDLASTATSLQRELGDARPGRRAVLRSSREHVEAMVSTFFDGGFPAIRHAYEPHCVTLGRAVRVPSIRPDGSTHTIVADAIGLDDDGALRVAPHGGGPAQRVVSGDVWLYEPSD